MENKIENIEQAVSVVQSHIEQRQSDIEKEDNIIVDEDATKNIAHQVISAKYFKQDDTTGRPHTSQASYLDLLDEESKAEVYGLLEIAEKSIPEALKESQKHSPYIMDAFHDILVRQIADSIRNKN